MLRRFDAHGNILAEPRIVGAVDFSAQLESGAELRGRLVVRSCPRVVTSGVPFTVEVHTRDGGAPSIGYQGITLFITKTRGTATLTQTGTPVVVGDRSTITLTATGDGGLAFRIDGDDRLISATVHDLIVSPAPVTVLPVASLAVARAPREATARDPFDVEVWALDRDGSRTTALDGQVVTVGQQTLDGARDDLSGALAAALRDGRAVFRGLIVHEPRDLLVKLAASVSGSPVTEPGAGWFVVVPQGLVSMPDRVLVVADDVSITDTPTRPVRGPQPIAIDHVRVANDVMWTSEAHVTRTTDASGLIFVTEAEPIIVLDQSAGDRVLTPGDTIHVADGVVPVRASVLIVPDGGVNNELVVITEQVPVIHLEPAGAKVVPDRNVVTDGNVLVKGIVRATESEIPGEVETCVVSERVVMVKTTVRVVNEPSRTDDRPIKAIEVIDAWLRVQNDTCAVTEQVVVNNQPPRGNIPDRGKNVHELPRPRSRRFIPALFIDPDEDFWDAILGPAPAAPPQRGRRR